MIDTLIFGVLLFVLVFPVCFIVDIRQSRRRERIAKKQESLRAVLMLEHAVEHLLANEYDPTFGDNRARLAMRFAITEVLR